MIFFNKTAETLVLAALFLTFTSFSGNAQKKIGDLYYNLAYPEAHIVPPPAVKVNGKYSFTCYQLDEVVIPPTVEDGGRTYTVTQISYAKPKNITGKSYGAFQNSNIKRVFIPYTVTKLGQSAFNNSSVEDIDFEAAPDESEDQPLELGQNAFTNCKKLVKVEIMREHFSQHSTISNVFSGCTSLQTAVLALTGTLPQGFFQGCTSLKHVEFLNHIDQFANSSFKDCTAMMQKNGGEGIFFWHNICPGKTFGTSNNEHNNIWGSKVENKSVEIHVPTNTSDEELNDWHTFANYGQVYITPVIKDEICGIEAVTGDSVENADAPAEFFNLQGIRVNGSSLAPGLYIRRQGNTSKKILVR